MNARQLILCSTIALVSGGLVVSCAVPPQQSVGIECAPEDISVQCLLQSAEETLAGITNEADWVSSAVELAIAYDSGGDQENAWRYISEAQGKLSSIDDRKKREAAIADIALGLKSLRKSNAALPIIEDLQGRLDSLEDDNKKIDTRCKLVTALAVHDSPEKARQMALALPQEGATANAYRGRTQREIAALFAKVGDFDSAISMLDEITADFSYYKAIAQTDIMSIAAKAGRKDIVGSLKAKAEAIAADQDNGYFAAGILRDIGHSYLTLEQTEIGMSYIGKALDAAAAAPKSQEKARATSRIATRVADIDSAQVNTDMFDKALSFARAEPSEMMRTYSLYEIAGSAAFSGNFELSEKLINELPDSPFLSATSLKSAAQRDLAWGLVKDGKTQQAITLANSISTPREKVHTLSRMVRLLNKPKMRAHPRYL